MLQKTLFINPTAYNFFAHETLVCAHTMQIPHWIALLLHNISSITVSTTYYLGIANVEVSFSLHQKLISGYRSLLLPQLDAY